MGTLHGRAICPPLVHTKLAGNAVPLLSAPIIKTRMLRSVFIGTKGRCEHVVNGGVGTFFRQPKGKRRVTVYCTFSSSSNDNNGSTAGNFRENDEDYVNSSVIEAGMISEPPILLSYFCVFGPICSWFLMLLSACKFSC